MQDKLRNSSILNMLLMGFLYTLDARAPRVVSYRVQTDRDREWQPIPIQRKIYTRLSNNKVEN